MRIVQFSDKNGTDRVGISTDQGVQPVVGVGRTYDAALAAIRAGVSLETYLNGQVGKELIPYEQLEDSDSVQIPVCHPDEAHCFVTGTGLTHLGSASARDAMHKSEAGVNIKECVETDSMRMFRSGVEGGKPKSGVGAQPEWFYKGDGSCIVAPGQALNVPQFAFDGSEEPEVAGVYIIGEDRTPWRIGYVLANEFSDHVMERDNYLLLAHSKLRACSLGPELLLGALPEHVEGESRVIRDGDTIWKGTFLTGEQHMSHRISNLEHHHFKYQMFRRPGDLHIHFFGTATLSFSDGIRTRPGDVFELEAPAFGRPLRNPLGSLAGDLPPVRAL